MRSDLQRRGVIVVQIVIPHDYPCGADHGTAPPPPAPARHHTPAAAGIAPGFPPPSAPRRSVKPPAGPATPPVAAASATTYWGRRGNSAPPTPQPKQLLVVGTQVGEVGGQRGCRCLIHRNAPSRLAISCLTRAISCFFVKLSRGGGGGVTPCNSSISARAFFCKPGVAFDPILLAESLQVCHRLLQEDPPPQQGFCGHRSAASASCRRCRAASVRFSGCTHTAIHPGIRARRVPGGSAPGDPRWRAGSSQPSQLLKACSPAASAARVAALAFTRAPAFCLLNEAAEHLHQPEATLPFAFIDQPHHHVTRFLQLADHAAELGVEGMEPRLGPGFIGQIRFQAPPAPACSSVITTPLRSLRALRAPRARLADTRAARHSW